MGFVWQKELALGADGGTINDVFNRPNQKAISPESTPFILVASISYQTPAIGSVRALRLATGGWTIGTILRYQSATPIGVPGAQNNLAAQLGRGTVANRVPGVPLFTKDLNCHCYDPSNEFVLNPAAWEDPAPGQWGTSAAYYNDYRGFRRPSEQLALGRNFRTHESVAVELKGMFFNVLNRTFLNNPDSGNARATLQRNPNGTTLSGFGRLNNGTTALAPREGVLSLRLRF